MGLRIGTAGWSIPRAVGDSFPGEGSHLERYARVLAGAEINSSFHRPHARATYERWSRSAPPSFRFAVKVPRTVTHEGALRRSRALLEPFLEESAGLGRRRGPLLVQLPPRFEFDARLAGRFFALLRELHTGDVVCEPRHASWFMPAADALLVTSRVARVAADPPPAPGADRPGGWLGLHYYRLHGSPRKYWSRYEAPFLDALAAAVRAGSAKNTWVIFDNTASGAAAANAIDLAHQLLL